MAIEHWLTEKGVDVIEKMGPLEWRQSEATKCQLKHTAFDMWWVERLAGFDNGVITDHEALCLLRDWAREWLAARGIYIRPTSASELGDWRIVYIDGRDDYGPSCRLDYDNTLIDAVLECMEFICKT